MPAKSKAQARLMNAAAHNPEFAREVGIKPSVAEDFAAKGRAYKRLPEKVKGPQKRAKKRG